MLRTLAVTTLLIGALAGGPALADDHHGERGHHAVAHDRHGHGWGGRHHRHIPHGHAHLRPPIHHVDTFVEVHPAPVVYAPPPPVVHHPLADPLPIIGGGVIGGVIGNELGGGDPATTTFGVLFGSLVGYELTHP